MISNLFFQLLSGTSSLRIYFESANTCSALEDEPAAASDIFRLIRPAPAGVFARFERDPLAPKHSPSLGSFTLGVLDAPQLP